MFFSTLFFVVACLISTAYFHLADQATLDFESCCRKSGLSQKATNLACKYPPEPVENQPLDVRKEISLVFNAWVVCYTGRRDNRECCRRKGVTGKLDFCLALCDGSINHAYLHPDPRFYICGGKSHAISSCNHGDSLMKGVSLFAKEKENDDFCPCE